MTIYFLKRPDGHIKIGRASNVNVRKKALEKSSGHKLMILGTMKSGIETEDSLHRRFNAQRGIGEWFAPSVELLDFISKSTSPSSKTTCPPS